MQNNNITKCETVHEHTHTYACTQNDARSVIDVSACNSTHRIALDESSRENGTPQSTKIHIKSGDDKSKVIRMFFAVQNSFQRFNR